jgi:hypothetical protein
MRNIDQLANWAYDFFYQRNHTEYTMGTVAVRDLVPENVKLPPEEVGEVINAVFNTDIEMVGRMDSVHLLKRTSPLSLNIFLRMADKADAKDLHSQANMNSVIAYLLSDMLIKGLTKHILLGLLNMDIHVKDIAMFLERFPELADMATKRSKLVHASITERFFKMTTLEEALGGAAEWTDDDFRVLFFQVLHTLAVIQHKYPTFRHNRLLPKFLHCYIKDRRVGDKPSVYLLGKVQFEVPSNGIDIKMYHFDNANIAGQWENADLVDEQKPGNRSYDCLTFLEAVNQQLGGAFPEATKMFVDEMLALDRNTEVVVPANLIMNHNYFSSLRNNMLNNNIMRKSRAVTDSETTATSSESEEMVVGRRTLKVSKFKPARATKSETETESETEEIITEEESSSSSSSESPRKRDPTASDLPDTLEDVTTEEVPKKQQQEVPKPQEKPKLQINELGAALGITRDFLRNVPTNTDPRIMSPRSMPHGAVDMTASPEHMMPQLSDFQLSGLPTMQGMNGIMPGMGMPSMGMPGMGMPGMVPSAMPGMGMPGMVPSAMPSMGMPGMGMPGMVPSAMPGMGMPGMGMPMMGGGSNVFRIDDPPFFFGQ